MKGNIRKNRVASGGGGGGGCNTWVLLWLQIKNLEIFDTQQILIWACKKKDLKGGKLP